ncbi:MAG TPA: hypothetical protein VLA84_21945 [Microcoleus sp.]|nr:hypothetical protein [Microcoleus sp.]
MKLNLLKYLRNVGYYSGYDQHESLRNRVPEVLGMLTVNCQLSTVN